MRHIVQIAVLRFTVLVCMAGLGAPSAYADYVLPMMGGGQSSGAMKHADVSFDDQTGVISIHVDDTVPTPWLRPLTPPDQFEPSQPYALALGTKAYNYQYAWNPGGFISMPAGAWIWIKRIASDEELEVYLRSPASPAWSQVLAHDGDIWKWPGSMVHNAYAVQDPTESSYSVTYQVYIGDKTTGAPLSGYTSDTVTWTWEATPVATPEPATLATLALGGASLLVGRWRRRARRAGQAVRPV